MNVRQLEIPEDSLRDEVLPLLRERVFHVTSVARYAAIERTGAIIPNPDGALGDTFPQSAGSYGRYRGYICLFDLRGKSEEAINWGLDCLYFLAPRELGDEIAFLIVAQEAYPALITKPESPVHHRLVIIPKVECWYTGNLSLDQVSEVLLLRVQRRPLGDMAAAVLAANQRSKPEEDG